VKLSLQKLDAIVANLIYQTMLIRDAAQPSAGIQVFEWFWLTDAIKRIMRDRFYKSHNAKCNFTISVNPKSQIFPKVRLKYR
jgi:hypothetical protein